MGTPCASCPGRAPARDPSAAFLFFSTIPMVTAGPAHVLSPRSYSRMRTARVAWTLAGMVSSAPRAHPVARGQHQQRRGDAERPGAAGSSSRRGRLVVVGHGLSLTRLSGARRLRRRPGAFAPGTPRPAVTKVRTSPSRPRRRSGPGCTASTHAIEAPGRHPDRLVEHVVDLDEQRELALARHLQRAGSGRTAHAGRAGRRSRARDWPSPPSATRSRSPW